MPTGYLKGGGHALRPNCTVRPVQDCSALNQEQCSPIQEQRDDAVVGQHAQRTTITENGRRRRAISGSTRPAQQLALQPGLRRGAAELGTAQGHDFGRRGRLGERGRGVSRNEPTELGGPVAASEDDSGHDDSIYALATTADAKFMATGSVDSDVRLWDVRDLRRSIKLSGHTVRKTPVPRGNSPTPPTQPPYQPLGWSYRY